MKYVKCYNQFESLQKVFQIATRYKRAVFQIAGDCMEGRMIQDGGHVAVDFTHYPRPGRRENGKYVSGDPCICYAKFHNMPDKPPNQPTIMCKVYDGFWRGHEVSTCYKQIPGEKIRMQTGFPAIAILGVVFASYGRDGKLIWETDPKDYPTDLSYDCMITGGNVDPRSVLKVVNNEEDI